MSQSLAKVLAHMAYSTKHRRPWLKDPMLRPQLYAYSAAVLKEQLESPAILINGTEDHIHILFQLSRKYAIKDVVQTSKTETSKWIKKQSTALSGFQWQAGYGIFSVSPSNMEVVKRYIANQEEHHKRISFQDEFRELCRKHGIVIDEQYVWD